MFIYPEDSQDRQGMHKNPTTSVNINQELESYTVYDKFRRNHTNRQLLAFAWAETGVKPSYPTCNKTMRLLVSRCGYLIGDNTVSMLIQARRLNRPKIRGGRGGAFQWSESELVTLLDALHQRRAFDLNSSVHRECFTPTELEKHRREASQDAADLSRYEQLPPRQLLLRIVDEENRNDRYLLSLAMERHLLPAA